MASLPTVDILLESAAEATGLSDFGPGLWRDGLEVLHASLRDEADLSALGEAIVVDRLGNTLRQRLQVHDWLHRHPEIGDVPVEGPVVVIGLPRTGTTALSNLLGADPATRAQRVWEAAAPCPPPDATSIDGDPRIAAAQAGIDMLHELKPIMRVIHDDEAGSIAEDFDLLALSFRSYQYTGMANVPSYARWLFEQDMTAAFGLHRQVLQLLSWRCPPHRWHLRNPATLLWIDAVIAVHPDARFVWCHRDPSAVLASVCELVAEVRDLGSDHVDLGRLGAEQLEDWARMLDAGMAARDRLGAGRFVDVRHEDVITDPLTTLATVYERVGWTWTPTAEAAARAWTDGHARGAHGEHHPELADYDLTREGVRERMADYCRRFSV